MTGVQTCALPIYKSKGEVAYTLIDIDGQVPAGLIGRIAAIHGVLSARAA